MKLKTIIDQYLPAYQEKYGKELLPNQLKALKAISRCRTAEAGELYVQCPDCSLGGWRPMSCGNRHCPRCQNHVTTKWIERQQLKLLPVPYFMVTFTLPYELRSLAYHHQKSVYSLLFACAVSTLKSFGLNHKHLGAEIGTTMVLHTNSRQLNYHPHVHAVVPGGGLDRRLCCWKRLKTNYLFNYKALAKVFRGRFLAGLRELGLTAPANLPAEWVVNCTEAGRGLSALKYLSRYLYRGVISEKNIVSNQDGMVCFSYIESETGETRYRTVKGEDFLHLIARHVLPKGFRRVRDFGFLHANAKRIRSLLQLILRVKIPPAIPKPRPAFRCSCCQAEMVVLAFRRYGKRPG